MFVDVDSIPESAVKLGVALFLGALLGAEREYKGRNIGFRTIILITLGSTLFTILSFIIGGTDDPTRIASNVVTGVGFLGAGAIFRDGVTVKGVTTASLIWVSAAIGMACGIGRFEFAIMVTVVALIVLIGFTGMQRFIDRYNKELIYKITIHNNEGLKRQLETTFHSLELKFELVNSEKSEDKLQYSYEIRGSQEKHERLLQILTNLPEIIRFVV